MARRHKQTRKQRAASLRNLRKARRVHSQTRRIFKKHGMKLKRSYK